MSNDDRIPAKQRALVLQGGVAPGAYEAEVFKAFYDILPKIDERNGETNRPLFDIVAGTLIGAINAAIIVSHFVKEKICKLQRLYFFFQQSCCNSFIYQDVNRKFASMLPVPAL